MKQMCFKYYAVSSSGVLFNEHVNVCTFSDVSCSAQLGKHQIGKSQDISIYILHECIVFSVYYFVYIYIFDVSPNVGKPFMYLHYAKTLCSCVLASPGASTRE